MKDAETTKANIIDLVRTPVMRMYTLVMGFNWFLCGLCFYGVSQFIGQLGKLNKKKNGSTFWCLNNFSFQGGNIFVNVALSAVIQIPSSLFACWSTKAWGRKKTLIFANVVSGLGILLIGKLVEKNLLIPESYCKLIIYIPYVVILSLSQSKRTSKIWSIKRN